MPAACGGAPPPQRAPAATTRDAIAAAEAHERARRHDEARAAYEAAIAGAPDAASEAWARLEYAETLATWGEVAGAVGQLEQVVALEPTQARAWHDLGILRHHLGDDGGARHALTRARALAPRDPRPRIALAALLWSTGELAAARGEYEALLDLDLPDRVRRQVEWALTQLPAPR